jgi:hypothetical protein
MSYNIEDHEDYLKKEMPYDMNEGKWQDLQQRIKEKVTGENVVPIHKPKLNFRYKALAGLVAGMALFFILVTPRNYKTGTDARISSSVNPEQQLDKAINSLNEDELNWIHELNENEISEQEEYMENQVQL